MALEKNIRGLISVLIFIVPFGVVSSDAMAGTTTVEGAVTPLTNPSQMGLPIIGRANFVGEDGPVAPDRYANEGLTFIRNPFNFPWEGIPFAGSCEGLFPPPILGEGSANGKCAHGRVFGTFDPSFSVTQVGLTASNWGTQYLTVWDKSGIAIGQVRWTPDNDSSFIGLDTGSIPIGMVSYTNDDYLNDNVINGGYRTFRASLIILCEQKGRHHSSDQGEDRT